MRGQLIGMTKDNSLYYGNKKHLHFALRCFNGKNDQNLVIVAGKGRVGKTRFVQEICSYFHMHNEFRHMIFFEDLSKIVTDSSY